MKLKTSTELKIALSLACTGLLGISTSALADFTKALTGGTPKVDIRYRYESVDQDGTFAVDNKAQASTIRTRLGYETGNFSGFSAFVEMENIADAGQDEYSPEKPGYPTIADPTTTELNQAYVQWGGMVSEWTGLPAMKVKVGRQRLILDNARFVGNIGWRQNEQTFGGATLTNESIDKLSLTYSYFNKRHTVTGTKADMNTHLLNAKYEGIPLGAIIGYAYLLDFDPTFGTDTQTIGARFDGKTEIGGGMNLLYTAEYANQSDYQDSTNIDAKYGFAEAGVSMRSSLTLKAGYELLGGSDGGTAPFQTPLATLHIFNGWADKFLSTPATGLQDVYVSAGGTVMGVNLIAAYHDFSSDEGSADFGKETNLQAIKKFGKTYAIGTKYAAFDGDSASTYKDTDKLWVWGEITF